MSGEAKRRWIYGLFAAVPLLYAAMFLPVWGGASLRPTGVPLALLAVQGICFVLAAVRLGLSFADGKCGAQARRGYFGAAAAVSVLILCVTAPVFLLELAGVPWFPAQR